MQFDLDIESDQNRLFKHLRSIILSFETIKEKKNPKQTTYYDSRSAVCMLRVRQGKVRLSFANGSSLCREFHELQGSAKIVRYLEFEAVEDVDVARIKEMLEESMLLNIEKEAVRELRKSATAR